MQLSIVEIAKPADANVIVGQAHFIKTVEDVYEALVQAVPDIKFGLAFCEASGPCLIRHTGTDAALEQSAVEAASAIGAGHVFVVILGNAFPVNVLNQIKSVSEVCTIFCATANPLRVIVAEEAGGRGVVGVIDGSSPKGVESAERSGGAARDAAAIRLQAIEWIEPRWIRFRDAANLIDEAVTPMSGGGRQPAKPNPAKKKPTRVANPRMARAKSRRRRIPARVLRDRILPRATVRRDFRADRAASRRADLRDFLRAVPDSRRRRPRSQRLAGSAGAVELFAGAVGQYSRRVYQGEKCDRDLPAIVSRSARSSIRPRWCASACKARESRALPIRSASPSPTRCSSLK